MSRNDETVEIIAEETGRSSDRAIRYDIDDTFIWIPKSLIADCWENGDGTWTLELPLWFAEQEGLV